MTDIVLHLFIHLLFNDVHICASVYGDVLVTAGSQGGQMRMSDPMKQSYR